MKNKMQSYIFPCLAAIRKIQTHFSRLTAWILLLLSIIPLPALASTSLKSALSVTVDSGYQTFKGAQNLKAGPRHGVKVGYEMFSGKNFADSLSLEGALHYGQSEKESRGADFYLLRIDALYPVLMKKVWQPYLLVGAGRLFVSDGNSSEGTSLVNFGFGLKYFWKNYLAFRADVRDVLYMEPGSENNPEFSLGVTYLFGQERKPKPVPPPDGDKDGVPDSLDRCSDTPRGLEVDSRGCPTDRTDTDGDGIFDYKDSCPDTPAGVSVDTGGCPVDTDGDGVPDHADKCPGTPVQLKVDSQGCVQMGGKSDPAPKTKPVAEEQMPALPAKSAPGLETQAEEAPGVRPDELPVSKVLSQKASTLVQAAPAPVTLAAEKPLLELTVSDPEAPVTDETPRAESLAAEIPAGIRVLPPNAAPDAAAPVLGRVAAEAIDAGPSEVKVPEVPAPEAPTPPGVPAESASAPVSLAVGETSFDEIGRVIVLYKPADETVPDEVIPSLKEIAAVLKKSPNLIAVVEGHADRTGDPHYNSTLSRQRAKEVEKILVGTGADPSQVLVSGYVFHKSIAERSSEEELQRDRRVEISLQEKVEMADQVAEVKADLVLYFEFEKAVLREEDRALLAKVIRRLELASAEAWLEVEGHTDNLGSEDFNLQLSRRRAEAVRYHLLEKGVPFSKIVIRGWGFYRPKADNGTEEGRQENRRVEIRIHEGVDRDEDRKP